MKTLQPRLIIRGVGSIVPGFGSHGREFGELVPTRELLANIQPLRPHSEERIPDSWVETHLGIRSVAMTTDTLQLCRQMWSAKPAHTVESAYVLSQSEINFSLYAMLQKTVKCVVGDVVARRPNTRITMHIHIGAGTHQFIEPALNTIRQSTGIADPTLCTMILHTGCAGLLFALDLADQILGQSANADEQVLITAESNMLFSAHLRARHTCSTNQDYNYWLWPAIFGEGAGAMLVGRPDETGNESDKREWQIEHLHYMKTECDTPVVGPVHDRDRMGFKIFLQARQVRENYLRHVTQHATEAINLVGGIEKLHRLCLHESNPLMLIEAANRVGVPMDRVPSVCAEVGTLAGVSAFTLLELALAEKSREPQTRIVCSLIGEAGGHLHSGCMSLNQVT